MKDKDSSRKISGDSSLKLASNNSKAQIKIQNQKKDSEIIPGKRQRKTHFAKS